MHTFININAQCRYIFKVGYLGAREDSRCKFDNSLNLGLSTVLSSASKFTRKLIRWLLLPIDTIHLRSIFEFYVLRPFHVFHASDSFEGVSCVSKFAQTVFDKMAIIPETQFTK